MKAIQIQDAQTETEGWNATFNRAAHVKKGLLQNLWMAFGRFGDFNALGFLRNMARQRNGMGQYGGMP